MEQRLQLVVTVVCLAACQPGETNVARSAAKDRAVRPPEVSTKVIEVTNLFDAPAPTQQPLQIAAPFSLTASDGTGLELTRLDAKAVVEGPLAFTELHLYFHNPEERTREGTFAITLPTGAAVSRFAMEIEGALMEAEVVEKQRARRVYEDFLHRKQDPALLEKAAGNEFSARVFPIAAKADKHLVISYSQEVTPGQYTLPLRGLAQSRQVDVRVQVRGNDGALRSQSLSQHNWKPDRDVVVRTAASESPDAVATAELVATRFALTMQNAALPPASITLLVDTSASRALGFANEARRVQELVAELARVYGAALPIQVIAFDQITSPLYDGRVDGATDIERALVQRGALGASDLGQALAWVGENAPKSRVVVVTDGVVTAGADLPGLRAAAAKLAGPGVQRIDVVLSGGIRDADAAAAIARAGLPHAGAVLDLDLGASEVARRLGLAVQTDLAVTATGAGWVFPRTIAAAQAGDEVTVFARREPRANEVAITIAGTKRVLTPIGVPAALLSRAVAGAEIAELDAKLANATGPAADTLRKEIVMRSVAARVVSSQTSLLVLESEADYQRYGIDRTALAEVLTVGPRGVELTRPVQIAKLGAPPRRPDRDTLVASIDPSSAPMAAGSSAGGDLAVIAPPPPPADDPSPPPPPPPSASAAPAPPAAELAMAQDAAERQAAMSRLSELRREQAEVSSRVAEARAAAGRAERLRGVRISSECMDNPLARGCMDGDSRTYRPPVGDRFEEDRKKPALSGRLADITNALKKRDIDGALRNAVAWQREEPGNVLALVGLGDALEAKQDLATAARVYGSIIDLFPARADFRRFAGERLQRLGDAQRALVIDTYKRAVAERPDHATGHRLLAYALVRDGQLGAAFAAILAGIDQRYPEGRFLGADRILAEDAGMIGAAYVAATPSKRDEVIAALRSRKTELATEPSTRFIMYWETDSNDVDFHIHDARGGHAYYSNKQLPSGGELYADITTGYGPECFAIRGTPTAGPYKLSINYFSQGPMGYGMGLLQIQTFDGKGTFKFEDRPYVIMTDHAFVDLGKHPQ